jgi:hypothetical protein
VKQLEQEITAAFRLVPAFGLAFNTRDWMTAIQPKYLNYTFQGLIPDPPDPNSKTELPPANILPLIKALGTKTMGEFLNDLEGCMDLIHKNVFMLTVTAFDSFLERRGFKGTLGVKYRAMEKAVTLRPELNAGLQEIIQRRNDVAHGGVVSTGYVKAEPYKQLHDSRWVQAHGVGTVGSDHDFGMAYLYLATSVIYDVAQVVASKP